MIELTLSEIAKATGGQLIGADRTIASVSTDTRSIQENGVFIALVGETFNGHDFIPQAVDCGAAALVVERQQQTDVPQIVVNDTKQALGKIGSWVHAQCDTPTIVITGSCGKTTVKEMVANILSCSGHVLFTAGNFNNDIGVPLTLLRSQPEDKFAVIELGANHQGEIAYTTSLIESDIALVNNVAAAHVEGFGSLDGVKKAKAEIFQGLKPNGTAVINLDSWGEGMWGDVLRNKKVVTFSLTAQSADFSARNIEMDASAHPAFTMKTPTGEFPVSLNIVGVHNVSNALAAAAIASGMGATIEDIQWGLSHLKGVKGRVDVVQLGANVKLIDDSYNASVPAMKAAIDLLATFSGCRWLILGNMAELGQESLALHRQVGEYAAPFKFEYVLTYGTDSQVIAECCGGQHFSSHESMMTYIEQQLANEHDHTNVLLIKGANSSGMSKIVAALKETYL